MVGWVLHFRWFVTIYLRMGVNFRCQHSSIELSVNGGCFSKIRSWTFEMLLIPWWQLFISAHRMTLRNTFLIFFFKMPASSLKMILLLISAPWMIYFYEIVFVMHGFSVNILSLFNNPPKTTKRNTFPWNFVWNVSIFNSDYVTECIKGLVQDCGNSIANALELLQYCTKSWIS